MQTRIFQLQSMSGYQKIVQLVGNANPLGYSFRSCQIRLEMEVKEIVLMGFPVKFP
jgi:hypothetical protein